MQTAVTRYHPLLVALHWIVALMVAASLVGGLALLSVTPNDDPMKPVYLRSHMIGGLALAALLIARLVTRLATARPPAASAGVQARIAAAVHWGFYLLLFAMLSTGLGMAALAGLWPLLAGGEVDLPRSFAELPPHAGHRLFARLLLGLIILHVGAAIWHAIRGQPIWHRMWFGPRRV